MRILVVCVGNVCRSPVGERLLQARLDAVRPGWAEVSSAGISAHTGLEMDQAARTELVRLGGDPTGFASRRVVREALSAADLLLTVTTEVRTSVITKYPKAMRRAYTLSELVAIVESEQWPGEPGSGIDELVTRASTYRHLGMEAVDLDDPYLQSEQVHRRVADEIGDLVDRLVPALVAAT